MVKLSGPMFALDASGTIGGTVTFSKWKGRNYARERVIPANPKSGAQIGRRGMFKFLTQAWASLAAVDQATWQDLADQLIASPLNAFIADNMNNWHNFLAPSQASDRAGAGNGSDRTLGAAIWEENRIKLETSATSAEDQWGIVYFAKLAGAVTPAVGNAILVELDLDILDRDTYWTPPSLGTWHFNSMTFSNDGLISAAGGPVNT